MESNQQTEPDQKSEFDEEFAVESNRDCCGKSSKKSVDQTFAQLGLNLQPEDLAENKSHTGHVVAVRGGRDYREGIRIFNKLANELLGSNVERDWKLLKEDSFSNKPYNKTILSVVHLSEFFSLKIWWSTFNLTINFFLAGFWENKTTFVKACAVY